MLIQRFLVALCAPLFAALALVQSILLLFAFILVLLYPRWQGVRSSSDGALKTINFTG